VRAIIPTKFLKTISRFFRTAGDEPYVVSGSRPVKNESPRSAREVFAEIYSKNLWGGTKGEIYSGPGSRFEPARLYAETVVNFIRENAVSTVLDLGCGDFAIGKEIAAACDNYIGVDVVPELIERNSRLFGTHHIEFRCLDISTDELPVANLCLIRQVFQHLSNKQILSVLPKLRRYPHLIITEHYPNEPTRYNQDTEHGVGTRVEHGSGVFLDKPPFSVSNTELLFETPPITLSESGEPQVRYDWGFIRTYKVTL